MTKGEIIKLGHWPADFLEGLVSEVPPITISGKVKLTWNCPIHGNYTHSIDSHLIGHRCHSCGASGSHKSRRNQNPIPESFIKDLHPDLREEVLSQKIPLGSRLKFLCPEHGYYEQLGYHHLNGHNGCPICRKKLRAESSKRSKRNNNPYPQWFLDELIPEDRERVLSQELSVNDEARFVCEKHGVYKQVIYAHISMSTRTKKCGCPSCAAEISKFGSSWEHRLRADLESLGVKTTKVKGLIKSKATGFPMELDIFCPDYNVAVEVNGLYYHSIEVMKVSSTYEAAGGKEFYHRMKTDLCKEKGILLVHLWEDDLVENYEGCLELVKSKLVIRGYKDTRERFFARKCSMVEVSQERAREFYDRFHIQGWGHGVCLGLEYKGELLSCMSFKKSASNTVDAGGWELNRYATRFGTFVVGGYEKLFKACLIKFNPKFIISYADMSCSDGALYKRTGWTLVGEVPVDYKYIYKGHRIHKFNFRIRRFKEDPDLEYRTGLTEQELAELNGIYRIYDCGKLKFRYENQFYKES